MSESQYYEVQAIDRPLINAELDELRPYSSRTYFTPAIFVNRYQ